MDNAGTISKADEASCCAIIAAFNEEPRVGEVVRAALSSRLFSEVVVVDDGSTDGTAEEAGSHGARVISHETNKGKPQALLTGLRSTEDECICFLDADLLGITTEHLVSLVQPVTSGKARATIGVFRGGRTATTLAQTITPMISGQRCMERRLLDGFQGWKSGYGVETELNSYLRRHGISQELVSWHGAAQVMKEEKVGCIRGFSWRIRMFWQIFIAWLRTKFNRHMT